MTLTSLERTLLMYLDMKQRRNEYVAYHDDADVRHLEARGLVETDGNPYHWRLTAKGRDVAARVYEAAEGGY